MLARHTFIRKGFLAHLNGGHGSRRDEDAAGCFGMAHESVWAIWWIGERSVRRVTVGCGARGCFARLTFATTPTWSWAVSGWSCELFPNAMGDTILERPRGDMAYEQASGVVWGGGGDGGSGVWGGGGERRGDGMGLADEI